MKQKRRVSPQATIGKQQPYDSVLKSLVSGHEQEILAFFLPGAKYLETLDIEALRTPLRLDRVYKVRYGRRVYILHIEFETRPNAKLPKRLLEYNIYLSRKHGYTVLSFLICPFSTVVPASPLRQMWGDREILTFHYHVIELYKLDASKYLREHAVSLYAFLPTMKGANAAMVLQAIDEMVEYYQDDEDELAQQLKWLGVLLRRADILPVEDKHKVEERLEMWDNLLEQDPYIKEKIATAAKAAAEAAAKAAEEKGMEKGMEKGLTEGARNSVIRIVSLRFPRLADAARQRVKHIGKADELEALMDQLLLATDEAAARRILNPPSA